MPYYINPYKIKNKDNFSVLSPKSLPFLLLHPWLLFPPSEFIPSFIIMTILKYEQDDQLEENPSFFLDSLLCEEEKFDDEDEEKEGFFWGEDLFWEDEELISMFSKEKQQFKQTHFLKMETLSTDPILSSNHSLAVEWILKVKSHYGFSSLTAVLAVSYFDRFLSSFHFDNEKPWMNQLVAVSCLSLAAKVEEIHVPLLLDLQVEDAKFVFEAKTIQRMELLILSTLQWKMHPITPCSFLDHIVRRLGFNNHLHFEFFKRCENLLLSLLSDSRFVRFLPSVLATATMMKVIDQIEPKMSSKYQDQLLSVLKMSKEKVICCYNLVMEHSKTNVNINANGNYYYYYYYNPLKRKYGRVPGSPSGVIDTGFSSDSSNDSWTF